MGQVRFCNQKLLTKFVIYTKGGFCEMGKIGQRTKNAGIP